MSSFTVRDVPEEVLARLDEEARRHGQSRNSLIVDLLTAHAKRPRVTEDLLRLDSLRDLADPEVMKGAWD